MDRAIMQKKLVNDFANEVGEVQEMNKNEYCEIYQAKNTKRLLKSQSPILKPQVFEPGVLESKPRILVSSLNDEYSTKSTTNYQEHCKMYIDNNLQYFAQKTSIFAPTDKANRKLAIGTFLIE